MRAPSANDLLLAWEQGLDQPPGRRALALLGAASAGAPPERLAALSIGERDARLLRLRESLFGNAVAAICHCPACRERLDVGFHIDDLRGDVSGPGDDASDRRPLRLRMAEYDITYRLPTSADLFALHNLRDSAESRRALLQRCVIDVRRGDDADSVETLPDEVITAISSGMAAADPQAFIEVALTCPACGHLWNAVFDIAAFLWSEVQAWAQRTLRDVHALARAYGWSEGDILAMSARRRQLYLALLQ